MYRRLLILHFKQSFEGREDTDLLEKLLAELPGIFQWALTGYKRLHARGRFEIPLEMLQVIEDLKRHGSSVSSFIADSCKHEMEADDMGVAPYISNRDFYDAYKDYYRDNGFRQFASNSFFKELRRILMDCEFTARWSNGSTQKVIIGRR